MPYTAVDHVEITSINQDVWTRDVDPAAYTSVPSGAVGIALMIINDSTGVENVGAQSADSTDDAINGMDGDSTLLVYTALGVTSAGKIDLFAQDRSGGAIVSVWIIGFFTSDSTEWVHNRIDITPAANDTWTPKNVDPDSDFTNTAIGAFLSNETTGSGDSGYQDPNSTDNFIYQGDTMLWCVAKCDGSEQVEVRSDNTANNKWYVNGIIHDLATLHTNAVTPPEDPLNDNTETLVSIDGDAKGALLRIDRKTAIGSDRAARAKQPAHTYPTRGSEIVWPTDWVIQQDMSFWIIGCNASGQCHVEIATVADMEPIREMGWFEVSSEPSTFKPAWAIRHAVLGQGGAVHA